MFLFAGASPAAPPAAPPAAQATPITLSFDHAVFNTPATPKMETVSPSTAPLKITADVDVSTGAFTVQPADWDFPEYTATSPVPGKLDVELTKPASGTANLATGALSMTAELKFKITVNGIGQCDKTTNLNMTTETDRPLKGTPFPAGPSGFVSGNGAFGAGWDDLPPGTGDGCQAIEQFAAGSGGFWVSRGIDPKDAAGTPKFAVSAKKIKAVKAGKTATVKATIKNSGTGDARNVKLCVAAPKPLTPKLKCTTISALAAGASKAVTFKVKTKKGKAGKYRLTLKGSGEGASDASKKLSLKVTK